jgi:hypothetical protein
LLDKDYLSLAEVQVMGVDPLRFAEVDYSSSEQNDFDGALQLNDFFGIGCDMKVLLIGMGTEVCFIRNNRRAFAALKADGSIMAWGDDWGRAAKAKLFE